MSVFQITGLLGTCNTIANILDSIRKCRKAKKKITPLVEDALSSLQNIKIQAPLLSVFVELGGIGMDSFRNIARRIVKVEEELEKLDGKLQKNIRIYQFVSANMRVEALGGICKKLESIERDLDNAIPLAQLRVQVSVLLEASPNKNISEDTKILLDNARQAFGTQVVGPQLDRLVSGGRSNEGVHYLIMGKMYFEGLTVEVNYEKSASFFQCAIKYGNKEAYSYLGKQYAHALGMINDESKAVELYMKGAELQDPECLFLMGQCFHYGYGVKKDDDMRFEFYSKAANFGHVDGQKKSAFCLELGIGTEVDYVQAAIYCKAAAVAGDVHALCEYGKFFLDGTGVERNEKVAVELFEIAGMSGSTYALVELGECYQYGLGVEEDSEKAFDLYSKAAEENNLDGIAHVGGCLVWGIGVLKDEERGLRYLREAARCGIAVALSILAELYRSGIAVEENKRKALVTYKHAAASGSWGANESLGEMYRNGEGVAVNMKKAIYHFDICAKYNQMEGHWNLALIYENEEGYLNKHRALYHFRFAADLGNLEALDVVGEYFVSVSGPRQLSFANDELRVFLRNIKTQFSRGNNNTSSILAPQEFSLSHTLDCTLPEFGNSQVVPPPSQPAIAEDPTTSEAVRYIAPAVPGPDFSFLGLMSLKYPLRWVIPMCLVLILFINLFMGILVSYVYLLYR